MLSTWSEKRREREKEREERALQDVKIQGRVQKYDRKGHKTHRRKVKNLQLKMFIDKSEEEGRKSATHAARAELVHHLEEPGVMIADDMERTCDLTQEDITNGAPLAVSQQYFNLSLRELGPYSINYSRNGRHLLLGGMKGHLASFDWRTKKLDCEVQVKETTRDIHYLHTECMFAAAQKQFVYIYDKTGTELHCVSKMASVNRLTFLPYHFLLVSANEHGVLGYLDVSIGQFVARHFTGLGPLRAMCCNPHNGVVHVGHHNGTVTLWTPNMSKPAVKMLCHRGRVSNIAMDREGRYMVTTGFDAKLRVWDIRQYKPLNCFSTHYPATSLDISQRGLVAFGHGNHCEVWKDIFTKLEPGVDPYLKYQLPGQLHRLQFCPFDDCLGLGHSNGFSSIIVPGAGEANLDGLEVNPYQTRRQRQEWEVKALLEKIPADLIILEPRKITEVYRHGKNEANDETAANAEVKETVVKVKKKDRRLAPGKLAARKQLLKDKMAREMRKAKVRSALAKSNKTRKEEEGKRKSVLDRFINTSSHD